jgi:ribose transport system permease protein
MNNRVFNPRATSQVRTLLILAAVNIIIMVALSFLSRTFLTYGNMTAVMMRMSELAMLAIAETIVIISGGFDLSVGATMALSGAVAGTLYVAGIPFPVAFTIALAAGVAVVALRLQPFIVTVATMTMVRSIVYALLKGNVLTEFPEGFLNLGYVYLLKIPVIFLIVAATAVLVIILLRRTIVGRRIFAIGANERTAFVSGIHVKRIKFLVYCLAGLICALGGLLFTARIRAIIPDAGINAPLEVITAVLIGGTLITGGKGSVIGSLLGILAMFLLLNGFNLLGLNPFWEVIILGLILIYVVGQESISRSFGAIFSRRKSERPASTS